MGTFNSANYVKPVVSGSSGQWGTLLNNIVDQIDTDFTSIDSRVTTLEGVTHVTAFLGLSDTPSSFTSSNYVRANSGGTALEFVTPSITELSDTPSNLGSANQILKMNSGGTALEWGTDASGGGGISLSEARNGLSHTQNSASGSGSFSYSASTGVMTYTPPNLSNYQTTASASKVFTSSWQSFQAYGTTGTSTFSHSLGGEPDIKMMQFNCLSSNLNYTTNDIVSAQHGVVSDASNVFGFYHDNTTQIKIVQPAYQRVQIVNKTTGVPQLITGSSWQWRVKCVKI